MIKRAVQRGIKNFLMAAGHIYPPISGSHVFLTYHSAAGKLPIELDISPSMLERQLDYLAQTKEIHSFDDALHRLQQKNSGATRRFVLTFDDGFLDFYTIVYPLLKRLNLPAILFVTTGFVEEREPYPMLGRPDLPVEPVTWDMLGEMAESGLVTLGAHTHTHPVLTTVAADRLIQELEKPIEMFRKRLGLEPEHFCYPRAEWNVEIEQTVAHYYRSAVIGGGEEAAPSRFHAYRIPRLPIRRSDGWRFFRAKVDGCMVNEEQLYNRLRKIMVDRP